MITGAFVLSLKEHEILKRCPAHREAPRDPYAVPEGLEYADQVNIQRKAHGLVLREIALVLA